MLNIMLQYVMVFYGHTLDVDIETDMQRQLHGHLKTQSFEYYDNEEIGKLMSRLTTDLFEISEVVYHGPEDIFITIMTLLGAFVLSLESMCGLQLLCLCYCRSSL